MIKAVVPAAYPHILTCWRAEDKYEYLLSTPVDRRGSSFPRALVEMASIGFVGTESSWLQHFSEDPDFSYYVLGLSFQSISYREGVQAQKHPSISAFTI